MFSPDDVGKSVVIRWAKLEQGRKVSLYTTIKEVQSDRATLSDAVEVKQAVTSGYIFFDNSDAFNTAIEYAELSGKTFKIDLEGLTYVAPNVNAFRDFSKGAPLFINGALKLYQEEKHYKDPQGVFNFLKAEHLPPYEFGFKDVDLLPRDCYDYNLVDGHYLVKFPTSGTPTTDVKFTLENSNGYKEKGLYNSEIEALLLARGVSSENLEYFKDLYFPFASPTYVKCGSLAKSDLNIVNNDIGRTRNYAVQFSLFNKRRGIHLNEIGNTIRGAHITGRTGLIKEQPVRALCNISADKDGAYRVLTISDNSPIDFNFNELANQYDQYFWKRESVSVRFKTAVDEKEKTLFVHNTKPYESKGVLIGTVKEIDGNTITLNKSPNYDGGESYGERVGGVIKYDSVIGDKGGTLQNVKANNTNSLVDLNGEARDFRGVCTGGGANNGATITITVDSGNYEIGESLYSWDLGTGDMGGSGNNPIAYKGNSVLLPKYLAYDKAYQDVEIDYFFYARDSSTHHIYTDGFADITSKDNTVVEGGFSLYMRDKADGNSAAQRRNFTNLKSKGYKLQNSNGGVTVIDGGIYNAYGNLSGIVHTYNTPVINGGVNAEIIDKDGSGYVLNGVKN